MSDDDDTARAARVAAARLAADLDPRLPEQVERALAEDPLGRAPERALDPISLGSLVVSLAALGWTIYRDIKKDRDAARGDRAARAAWLSVRLRQDGIEALRQPAGITEEQRARFIEVVAEEVVKTTPSP